MEMKHNLDHSRKENKKVLDKEEKRLGKISDKNSNVQRDLKTKALRRHK